MWPLSVWRGPEHLRPPAGADPIGATRAQISATQAEIDAGAAQVHALTVTFQQANLAATTLGQQVRADQTQIAQLQSRVSGNASAVLRRQALLSYTGGAGSNLGVPTLSDPSVQVEYLQVATGNLDEDVDQFRTQQRQLATAEATLTRQQHQPGCRGRRSPGPPAGAGGGRQHQARLNQLQAQLNHYIEAAGVAAQQQAAAAAAAARRSRPDHPGDAGRPMPRPPPRRRQAQGLPVNGGLVSVVQSIVSPPPPPPAPAPPACGQPAAGWRRRGRRRVAAAARVRVRRQLRGEHRKRLLRRLPVQ